MKEYMVEMLYQWGVVYKFHVEAEDGGIAWNLAVAKARSCPGARPQANELRMVSIVHGEMTSLGWRPFVSMNG
jgi:hypothetical protein